MTADAISGLLMTSGFITLGVVVGRPFYMRGLVHTLERISLAFYCASEAVKQYREKELVLVERREAR